MTTTTSKICIFIPRISHVTDFLGSWNLARINIIFFFFFCKILVDFLDENYALDEFIELISKDEPICL